VSQILPDKLTPLTPDEAAKAISDGYKSVVGHKPSKKILLLLLGQTALETGNWKSIHNYNFGNAKATSSDLFAQYFACGEVEHGVEVHYPAGDPHCIFAAHQTAADGAAHYIRVLRNRDHWWKGLNTGTVPGFIRGLTTTPVYFTANPITYASVLSDRASRYTEQAKRYSSSTILQILGGIAVGALAFVGASQLRKRV
jgi:hypothetical protein